MVNEFKDFIAKFNVVPIAIGLVLAVAFVPVVDATANLILTFVGAIFGADETFDDLSFNIGDTPIPYGTVLTAGFAFLIVAFVVFWIVKGLKRAGITTDMAKTPDVVLLEEIRDLLSDQAK